jgi:hypothetical protein
LDLRCVPTALVETVCSAIAVVVGTRGHAAATPATDDDVGNAWTRVRTVWDSIAIRVDIEMGATANAWNHLIGM